MKFPRMKNLRIFRDWFPTQYPLWKGSAAQAPSLVSRVTISRVCSLSTNAVIFCSFGLYLWFLVTDGNPFPFNDEWDFIFALLGPQLAGESVFTWIFSAYDDHRFPLVKIYTAALLKAGNFDTRILQLANGLVICLCSYVFMRCLRARRGSADFGDISVSLVIWGTAIGVTLITGLTGFHRMSSTLFLIGFGVAATSLDNEDPESPPMRVAVAFLCLFGMTLCGMNGTVPAMIISIGLLVAIPVFNLYKSLNRTAWLCLLLTFVSLAGTLIFYRTGYLTKEMVTLDYLRIVSGFLHLMNYGRPVSFDFQKSYLLLFNILLIGIATVALGVRLLRSEAKRISDLFLFFAIVAGVALAISISAVRSSTGWHYAIHVIPPVILSWIAISFIMPRPIVAVVGILSVCVGSLYMVDNIRMQSYYQKPMARHVYPIYADLFAGMDVETFAPKHIGHFFDVFSDTPIDVRCDLERKIFRSARLLSQHGYVPWNMLKASDGRRTPGGCCGVPSGDSRSHCRRAPGDLPRVPADTGGR